MAKEIQITGFRRFPKGAIYLYRKSFKYNIVANSINNFDQKFDENIYLYGGSYEVIGDINDGDYIEMSIVDIDNITGGGANKILVKFLESEYINIELKNNVVESEDANCLLSGLYLRLTYVSVGVNSPKLIVRYLARRG